MNTVRAKFKVESVRETEFNKAVKLNAISGKEGENATFTKYTPWGTLEIGIDKDTPAADFFKPGDEMYLDFTKAEK